MSLSRILFFLAAVLSMLVALAHEVLGAPKVLAPLAETDLPGDVIWLHHFSWHVGTITVLAMAALFVLAARHGNGRAFGIIATLISTALGALGIGLAVFGDGVLWTTPAPYPWTLIALIGFAGIATDRGRDTPAP